MSTSGACLQVTSGYHFGSLSEEAIFFIALFLFQSIAFLTVVVVVVVGSVFEI